MAEQLQHLINRIRTEAVDSARDEAETIRQEARDEAESIVAKAQAEADTARKEAEKAAALSEQRGRQALDQAARDTLASLGQRVGRLFDEVLGAEVKDALDAELTAKLLDQVVAAYVQKGDTAELTVPEAQREALLNHLKAKLAERVGENGVVVKTDERLEHGFRLALENGRVVHDFSSAALAEALGRILRPDLAAQVREAAKADG